MFMLWLSWDDLLDRGRMRISAETCLGVLIRLSIGELSLFDSVLESGRKISTEGSDCEQLDISIWFFFNLGKRNLLQSI